MNTIYLGAAAGGVFKSTDAGTTWQPVFYDAMSLSIGDIAIEENHQETELSVYPNPFVTSTKISLNGTGNNDVIKAGIYDIAGNRIRSFVLSGMANHFEFVWNGTDNSGNVLPGGIYPCIVETGGKTLSKKIVKQ